MVDRLVQKRLGCSSWSLEIEVSTLRIVHDPLGDCPEARVLVRIELALLISNHLATDGLIIQLSTETIDMTPQSKT